MNTGIITKKIKVEILATGMIRFWDKAAGDKPALCIEAKLLGPCAFHLISHFIYPFASPYSKRQLDTVHLDIWLCENPLSDFGHRIFAKSERSDNWAYVEDYENWDVRSIRVFDQLLVLI